jgi:hypothetical protein
VLRHAPFPDSLKARRPSHESKINVVAGVGFEPTTFGL